MSGMREPGQVTLIRDWPERGRLSRLHANCTGRACETHETLAL